MQPHPASLRRSYGTKAGKWRRYVIQRKERRCALYASSSQSWGEPRFRNGAQMHFYQQRSVAALVKRSIV
eukprot:scaffold1307_cov200-Pinguiococcus_pyrenoidosus.AAC.85